MEHERETQVMTLGWTQALIMPGLLPSATPPKNRNGREKIDNYCSIKLLI